MSENSSENRLVRVESKTLDKIFNALTITKKNLSSDITIFFNEAFYLLSSDDIDIKNENYLYHLKNDKDYLRRKLFTFYATDEDCEQAIVLFSKAINLDSNLKEGFYFRGVAKFSLCDYKEANADFDMAFSIDPKYADGYFYRAYLKSSYNSYNYRDNYEYRDNFEEIITDCNTAIELDEFYGSKPEVYFCLANAYIELKEFQNALKACDKWIELDKNNAEAWYYRANTKNELQQFDEALFDYNRCIELEPNDKYYYSSRAIVHKHFKDYDKAILDSNKTIDISLEESAEDEIFGPSEGDYLFRAECKVESGDLDGAIQDFYNIIDLEYRAKGNVALWYDRISQIKIGRGMYADAISDFTKAIESDPSRASRYVYRGECKFNLGLYYDAIDDYSKAIEIDNENFIAYKGRSEAKKMIGDFKGRTQDVIKFKELINNQCKPKRSLKI